MKIKLLSLLIVTQLLGVKIFSQTISSVSRNPLKSVSFLDSSRFVNDLVQSKVCVELYRMAKDSSDYVDYQYNFKIGKNNYAEATMFEKDPIFLKLNGFIKQRFNHYRWSVEKDKKRQSSEGVFYGVLHVIMLPMKKLVRLQITISDGKIKPWMNVKTILYKNISENSL